jgi:nucleotide-binding universal stress UspA family protein
MHNYQHILAVTDDPLQINSPFQKAVILASKTHSKLTLLTVKLIKTGMLKRLLDKSRVPEIKSKIAVNSRRLRQALKYPIKHISCQSSSIHHAVLNELKQEQYDLVVLPHKRYHTIISELISADEWHLLRETSVPMMYVNGSEWQTQGHVLAALEINHTQARHQAFNAHIIHESKGIADTINNDLHFINCYLDDNISMAFESEDMARAHSILAQQANQQSILNSAVAGLSTDKYHCHIAHGLPEDAIPIKAHQLDVNMLIMGAAEHTGLINSIKGHISERLINQIPCDILAIKPSITKH